MTYLLSHRSALEFWSNSQAKIALSGKRLRAKKPPTRLPDTRGFCKENPLGLSLPLHVLVGSSNARKVARNLHCHISSEEYPSGSFIEVADGVMVCSPELCFIQMAEELSLAKLVLLGFELCGRYRPGNKEDEARGFRDDLPLTSVAKLKAYLSKAPVIKGKKAASRALQFVVDNSASPMESILTILLTLPYRLGGYGLEMPLLNYPITIPGDTKKRTRKKLYLCDLFWPRQQIAVEYDSDDYHALKTQIAKDAIRRNDLISAGITVIVTTRKQVRETGSLRELAEILGKLLNKRMRYQSKEFPARHANLRAEILSSASFYS